MRIELHDFVIVADKETMFVRVVLKNDSQNEMCLNSIQVRNLIDALDLANSFLENR
jgi:hypothetical protein